MNDVWYGSVNNRIMERSKSKEPEIGMGVTECLWSDRHAWEIIAIKDDRHITVRRMGHKCLDYYAGDYEVFSDPNGVVINLFKTKTKGWRQRIGTRQLGCNGFYIGYAEEYEDPSF